MSVNKDLPLAAVGSAASLFVSAGAAVVLGQGGFSAGEMIGIFILVLILSVVSFWLSASQSRQAAKKLSQISAYLSGKSTDADALPSGKGGFGRLSGHVKAAREAIEKAAPLEEALRETKDKLSAVGRAQAVIEFTMDGEILDANENFLAVLGYRLEDIVGKHHSMFVDAEYSESRHYAEFWRKLGRGEFHSGKFRRVSKDGDEIWIQATYNPILDADGNAYKVVKFATDITQTEKDATTAVFKSSAFEESSVAMMMVDRDFVVTHVNRSTKELLRKNADAFREVWPSFDDENIIGACIDMFHKNPAHQRQLLSDPKRLPYRTDITVGDLKFALSVGAVFDQNGAYVGNVLEWADVTADRLNAGMLSALDRSQATIEFDIEGKIIHANENFLDVMGYTLEEIKGKRHSMFVERDYALSPDYRAFWEKLGRGEYEAGKYKRIGRGGKEVWIQAGYNPILDGNGKPFKVVKFASDVTEVEHQAQKEEAERQQRAAEQAVVVDNLANGLNRLSDGDFSIQIDTDFAEEYDQLRLDFNAAVEKLQLSENERRLHAEQQQYVVENLAGGLKALSDGNLQKRIDEPFSSEYEQLRRDFNGAVDTLHNVMTSIVSTAKGIRRRADEISQSADDLSKRTENQAATLEETAAALDEITATVRQSSSGADEANNEANDTRTSAQQSGEVVREAVEAMSEIESSSKQISQIISVIDDIAFQTNLLALNAGVEAARAGEAGRGFAVVAQEVRALAQRSSDAAKEIKGLISSSSQHVETGVDLVGRAGEALSGIVSRVETVTELIATIATSAKEQSVSLSEVNSAVNKMDQVTQQNAAMVEQSTAASHSLTHDSEELLRRVLHFNIGEDRRAGRREGSAADRAENKAAAPAPEEPVKAQQKRAAAFATNGSAAVADEGWQDF